MAKTNTNLSPASTVLRIVASHGNMDRDDLDPAALAAALAAGLVVDVRGFIYPATSRHAR